MAGEEEACADSGLIQMNFDDGMCLSACDDNDF